MDSPACDASMGNTIKTINRLSLTARHVYIGLLRFAQQLLPIVSRSRRRPRYSFRVCHPAGKSLAIDFPDFNGERLLAKVNITAPHYPGQIIVIEALESQVAALPLSKRSTVADGSMSPSSLIALRLPVKHPCLSVSLDAIML